MERSKVFREAYEALQREIPNARVTLEAEFRELLGGPPSSKEHEL
jgi:hypothetical protein